LIIGRIVTQVGTIYPVLSDMAAKRKFEDSMECNTEYSIKESTKRKFQGNMNDCNTIRRFNDSNRDKFEYTHLHRTNQEMADFVREAIVVMRAQQQEIEQLKSIIRLGPVNK